MNWKFKLSCFCIQIKIFIKFKLNLGALSYTTEDSNNDEKLQEYLVTRNRIHSIDIGELQGNSNFSRARTNELVVVHKNSRESCKRWRHSKTQKVFVKGLGDDDMVIVPTFLLTYNPKFSRISNQSFKSFSVVELNEIDDE